MKSASKFRIENSCEGRPANLILENIEGGRVIVRETNTGRYMTVKRFDRERCCNYYTLFEEGGNSILGTEVVCWIEKGKLQKSVMIDLILERSWVPSGRAEKPKFFSEDRQIIFDILDFIKALECIRWCKTHEVYFQFSDIREESRRWTPPTS